jgi:hypothetical protein
VRAFDVFDAEGGQTIVALYPTSVSEEAPA